MNYIVELIVILTDHTWHIQEFRLTTEEVAYAQTEGASFEEGVKYAAEAKLEISDNFVMSALYSLRDKPESLKLDLLGEA